MTILRDAALELAARGLRVFPCRWHAKEPLINDPLRRATTDPNVISGWWGPRGNYNIGIATGSGSDCWVLDIDGPEGEQTLRDLEATHGKLPETATVATGKGKHFYFRWPTDVDIRNFQCRDDLPGVDVRGNGGFVVCPPSTHPSGAVYTWIGTDGFADAPSWLVGIATSRNRSSKPAQAAPPEAWLAFLGEQTEGSRRGSAIAKLSGMLLRKFLDPMVALELVRMFNSARCDPPLDDFEVVRIVTTIARRELERREYRS